MPDMTGLSEAAREALDDLWHNCDLIACRPLPCEVVWTLERVGMTTAESRAFAGLQ